MPDFLTIINNAVQIDNVDHLIFLQIVYWYELGKQEHTAGSTK